MNDINPDELPKFRANGQHLQMRWRIGGIYHGFNFTVAEAQEIKDVTSKFLRENFGSIGQGLAEKITQKSNSEAPDLRIGGKSNLEWELEEARQELASLKLAVRVMARLFSNP